MGTMVQQFRDIWMRLELPQRATIVLVAIGFAVLVGVLSFGATRNDYTLLVGDISRARTYEIIAFLDEEGVDYRVIDHETAILVPSKDRYRLLKQLSDQDLLSDGSDGFELLEDSRLGESTFVEQKKYDRAVAGELERIVREFDGVSTARVLIQRAPASPFLLDEAESTATVKITMDHGKRLKDRQISGIVQLCTGAVEGLMPENVHVADGKGLLTRPDAEPGALAASDEMEAETTRESYLTRKAQEIMDRSVGPGNSLVTVSVDLDFTERSEVTSQPVANPVVARTRSIESDESTPVPINEGVVGTAANIENRGNAVDTEVPNATKTMSDTDTSYVVGNKQETINYERALIRGMTVSIITDYKAVDAPVPAEDDNAEDEAAPAAAAEPNYEPLSAEELAKLEKAVLNGIGFYAAKGAQLAKDPEDTSIEERFASSIETMPFYREEAPEVVEAGMIGAWTPEDIGTVAKYGIALIAALGLLLIARGQLKRSHSAWKTEQERIEREREEEEKQRQAAVENVDHEAERRLQLRDAVREHIREDPSAAAQVLKNWMYE